MHAFLIRFRRRTFHVLSFRSSRYSISLTRSSHEKFRSLRTESWCKYCWILIEMADQKKTRRSKIEGDGKRVKEAPSPTQLSVFPYPFLFLSPLNGSLGRGRKKHARGGCGSIVSCTLEAYLWNFNEQPFDFLTAWNIFTKCRDIH